MLQKDDVERIVKNYIRDHLRISVGCVDEWALPNERRIQVLLDDDVIHTEYFSVEQRIDNNG